jgi:hypothetical protein
LTCKLPAGQKSKFHPSAVQSVFFFSSSFVGRKKKTALNCIGMKLLFLVNSGIVQNAMCAVLDLIVSGPRLWNDLKREVKFMKSLISLLRLSSSFQFLLSAPYFGVGAGCAHVRHILGLGGDRKINSRESRELRCHN